MYKGGAITTKLTRRYEDLSGILVCREAAAERTLFGYTKYVNRQFSAAHLKRSNVMTKEIAVEEISINASALVLGALVIIGMFAMMRPARNGMVTGGFYIAMVGALVSLSRMITGSVARLICDAAGHIEYMRDYARFWKLPESEERATPDGGDDFIFERLEIRNLRFRYAPNGEYVLNGVNLVMERGRAYSLIGPNGAGKSTLTKILLGLYRDYEGEILLNGVDIAQYDAARLRRCFSIVYQDFAKYAVSLRDNITLGNHGGDFKAAVRLAELDDVATGLAQKEHTPLGKVLGGGSDVSGGEWQKIAIARALYANAPFIILDEPTSSLSPTTESRLYRRFAEITRGKTSLLISHRLGSTKLSDVLFVLDRGVIAETGTHDALMAANGIYAEMFLRQRSWYDEREPA